MVRADSVPAFLPGAARNIVERISLAESALCLSKSRTGASGAVQGTDLHFLVRSVKH